MNEYYPSGGQQSSPITLTGLASSSGQPSLEKFSATVGESSDSAPFGGIQQCLRKITSCDQPEAHRYWPNPRTTRAWPETDNIRTLTASLSQPSTAEDQFLLGALLSNGIGAHNAYSNGERVVQLYAAAEKQGHVEAQTKLGYKYAMGCQVQQRPKLALSLLKLASKHGSAKASFMRGVIYEDGLGVPINRTKAKEWYQISANQGSIEAQFQLGTMISNGIGIEEADPSASATLYENAAKQGHPAAQERLGYKYLVGSGVDCSFESATQWLQKASKQQYVPAQERLALLQQARKNYSDAAKWAHEALLLGSSKSQSGLANMHRTGKGARRSSSAAGLWDSMTALQRSPVEQFQLGEIFEKGTACPRDPEAARIFYTRAANLGYIPAMKKLQFVYISPDLF